MLVAVEVNGRMCDRRTVQHLGLRYLLGTLQDEFVLDSSSQSSRRKETYVASKSSIQHFVLQFVNK